MPHFLFKKPKTFSVKFTEIEEESNPEPPFWEIQRSEALNILTTFFTSWQAVWKGTVRSLGTINLSEEGSRRLLYYENEQKQTVVELMAKILVAWEKDEQPAFSEAVLGLAKELRPSLENFETANEELVFTPIQAQIIRNYTKNIAICLKTTIENLQKLSWHKLEFGDKVLTLSNAKALIEEKLNLEHYGFLDFNSEPEFATGFLPELLQESADFGL